MKIDIFLRKLQENASSVDVMKFLEKFKKAAYLMKSYLGHWWPFGEA